jgi:hypothetical protein
LYSVEIAIRALHKEDDLETIPKFLEHPRSTGLCGRMFSLRARSGRSRFCSGLLGAASRPPLLGMLLAFCAARPSEPLDTFLAASLLRETARHSRTNFRKRSRMTSQSPRSAPFGWETGRIRGSAPSRDRQQRNGRLQPAVEQFPDPDDGLHPLVTFSNAVVNTRLTSAAPSPAALAHRGDIYVDRLLGEMAPPTLTPSSDG